MRRINWRREGALLVLVGVGQLAHLITFAQSRGNRDDGNMTMSKGKDPLEELGDL